MLKSWILVMIICAVALSTFSQTPAKYEVATILDIKPHEPADENSSPAGARYDVSVKVADTIYLVLYTDTLGANTVKYAAGREGLVQRPSSSTTCWADRKKYLSSAKSRQQLLDRASDLSALQ